MVGKTNFAQLNADLEKMEEKAANRGNSNYEKPNYWSLKFGDSELSICPPKDDDAPLYKEVELFYFEAADGTKRVYKSSEEKFGTCPLKEHSKKLWKDGKKKEASDFGPKRSVLYNAVDSEGKNRLLMAKPSQHKEIMAELREAYCDGDDITELDKGYILKVSRLKADPWARARLQRKTSPRSAEEVKAIEEGLYDLTGIYEDIEPDKLALLLTGGVEALEEALGRNQNQGEEDGNSEEEGQSEPEAAEEAPAEQEEEKAEKPRRGRRASKPAEEPAAEAEEVKQEASEPESVAEDKTAPAEESTGDADMDELLGMIN